MFVQGVDDARDLFDVLVNLAHVGFSFHRGNECSENIILCEHSNNQVVIYTYAIM